MILPKSEDCEDLCTKSSSESLESDNIPTSSTLLFGASWTKERKPLISQTDYMWQLKIKNSSTST